MSPDEIARARLIAEDAIFAEDVQTQIMAYLLLIVLDAKDEASDVRH